MPLVMEVSLEGRRNVDQLMARLDPRRHGVKWLRNSLERGARDVHKTATEKKIRRGGKTRKGASKPLLGVLTSRSGRLRGSIAVDLGPLPTAVDVGTNVKYAAIHELGLTVKVPKHLVRPHWRDVVFGKKVSEFLVPRHTRGPYSARFPMRPYLLPALEEVIPKLPRIFTEEIEKVLGGSSG